MKGYAELQLLPEELAVWWLGQAGYIFKTDQDIVVIDPYLSDSAAGGVDGFSRLVPVQLEPGELQADIVLITHNHLDHLDPDTLKAFPNKDAAWFVAPWLTAKKLEETGIPSERIVIINAGESRQVNSVSITGVFALPTGSDVLDTTGYLLEFSNGRTVYHTSDTQFHPLVLEAAPREVELMLVPINGKWKNTNAEEAALFAKAVAPQRVAPNHYDMMALNAENPSVFEWFCAHHQLTANCIRLPHFTPYVWGA